MEMHARKYFYTTLLEHRFLTTKPTILQKIDSGRKSGSLLSDISKPYKNPLTHYKLGRNRNVWCPKKL